MKWMTRGDVDGFFGLALDNLVQLLVIDALCRAYPGLSPGRLVGHSDIAPGRKTDPGPGFDWCRLRTLLELESTP